MTEKPTSPPVRPSTPTPSSIPVGYRPGLLTAISVVLGFSLAFLRFWGFEAPGVWTPHSVIAAVVLIAAIVLEVVTMIRSLRLEDDEPSEYRKTIKWFATSIVVLLVAVLVAVFSAQ